MKKIIFRNNIFLVAKKSNNYQKKLDYFLQLPNGDEEYAFTRNYSTTCYELCKSGMPINEVLYGKKNNTAFMSLVKYLNFMMPYFVEYMDLGQYICNSGKTKHNFA